MLTVQLLIRSLLPASSTLFTSTSRLEWSAAIVREAGHDLESFRRCRSCQENLGKFEKTLSRRNASRVSSWDSQVETALASTFESFFQSSRTLETTNSLLANRFEFKLNWNFSRSLIELSFANRRSPTPSSPTRSRPTFILRPRQTGSFESHPMATCSKVYGKWIISNRSLYSQASSLPTQTVLLVKSAIVHNGSFTEVHSHQTSVRLANAPDLGALKLLMLIGSSPARCESNLAIPNPISDSGNLSWN